MKEEKIIPFTEPDAVRRQGKAKSRPFVKIDNRLMDEKGLTSDDKFCYAAIRRFSNKEGKCWPTHKQIGEICDVEERSINTRIRALRKFGWLQWVHFRDKDGRRRNRYTFTNPETVAQQQLIAAGQQQPIAVKEEPSTLYCDTSDPAGPDRIQEQPPDYGGPAVAL